ncbi:hypothetical protein AQF98_12510 [Pedobacter sp. Hv1]|nr:hypothetical protein AQF98_12510 [Pedobacter sp. Hv1]
MKNNCALKMIRLVRYGLLLMVAHLSMSISLLANGVVKPVQYFIDNVNGNDNYLGKSSKQAWKTLAKVNAQVFQPGDQVLFKRGGKWKGQLVPKGSGTKTQAIVFSAYGKGALPQIAAEGKFRDVVLLHNLSNISVKYLDLSNHDPEVKEQKTGPTGVRILAEDIGTISNIQLSNLYIHDINGDNKKGSKEGHGIFWDCQGPKPSRIENLLIEHCRLERVDRNGIRGNGTFGFRDNWFPNKNLIIRNCKLEDIGGDGIVIKAFDGALVEHNQLFHVRTRAKDNAVGIWPHSSDNTVIQYNEVAYTKNQDWSNDGQSFDIDGNCNHTIIQNNYSHDNEGGFMLVISDAINAKSRMTTNSIIRNNLSINDGNKRKRLFNFALVTDSTLVSGNVFLNSTKDSVKMELVDIEHGVPKHVVFENNIIQYQHGATAVLSKSPTQYAAVTWKGNSFKGNIVGKEKLLNVNDRSSVKPIDLKKYPFSLLEGLKLKIY